MHPWPLYWKYQDSKYCKTTNVCLNSSLLYWCPAPLPRKRFALFQEKQAILPIGSISPWSLSPPHLPVFLFCFFLLHLLLVIFAVFFHHLFDLPFSQVFFCFVVFFFHYQVVMTYFSSLQVLMRVISIIP